MLVLEALHEPIDHARVDIFSAEEGVACGRNNLENTRRRLRPEPLN